MGLKDQKNYGRVEVLQTERNKAYRNGKHKTCSIHCIDKIATNLFNRDELPCYPICFHHNILVGHFCTKNL